MKATPMFRTVSTSAPLHRPALSRGLSLLRRLPLLLSLRRQRRSLAQLDDHLLRDIGLTPEQALAEADRPIWDAPAHWRA
jgi:uncharacterized protein YjiS (DUF1127 family)